MDSATAKSKSVPKPLLTSLPSRGEGDELSAANGREISMSMDEGDDDDAHSILAVSISRAQSYLASPRTPAVEKAAALQHRDGGGLFDPCDRSVPGSGSLQTEQSGNRAHQPRASLIQPSRIDDDALPMHRKRGSSTSFFNLPDLNLKKLIPSAVPSLPKAGSVSQLMPSIFPSIASSGNERSSDASARPRRSNTLFSSPLPGLSGFQMPNFVRTTSDPSKKKTESQERPQTSAAFRPLVDGPKDCSDKAANAEAVHHKPLRRSTSDQSLQISRTISRVSSLGDDSKFNEVQNQVNSRFKAIKDSFADSSFRISSKRLSYQNSKDRSTGSISTDSVSKDSLRSIDQVVNEKNRRLKFPSISAISSDQMADQQSDCLADALQNLHGDVVVLGGYRGSILRSAKPPHRQLWAPVKIGLNLRKVDLEVGLSRKDEEDMEKNIISSGMLTHIGPVDISRRLLKKLRHSDNAKNGSLRVWDYGYDWRLSPHLLSDKLRQFLARLPCNSSDFPPSQRGATIIAHSLGGLITRHAVNIKPGLFRGVLFAGVPQACVNILGPLRNGDEVLLSSKVLTAQVNFTLRTSFVLLPDSGRCFFDKKTMEEYPIDFFDVKTWSDYHLSPCINPSILTNEPNSTVIDGILESVSSSLPNISFPGARASTSGRTAPVAKSKPVIDEEKKFSIRGSQNLNGPSNLAGKTAQLTEAAAGGTDVTVAPQMGTNPKSSALTLNPFESNMQSKATSCTIPLPEAIEYLDRTLKETLQFRKELSFKQEFETSGAYPPFAVLYGKTVPTVRGAKVDGREGIKYDTAYNDLIFGAGDGVVLAKEAMLPDGYHCARGGRISSDRGHVTLLGDLEGVGRCLRALIDARSDDPRSMNQSQGSR